MLYPLKLTQVNNVQRACSVAVKLIILRFLSLPLTVIKSAVDLTRNPLNQKCYYALYLNKVLCIMFTRLRLITKTVQKADMKMSRKKKGKQAEPIPLCGCVLTSCITDYHTIYGKQVEGSCHSFWDLSISALLV